MITNPSVFNVTIQPRDYPKSIAQFDWIKVWSFYI